jgi:exportin-5
MISHLGALIEHRPSLIPEDCDLPNFLNLLLEMVRNESLMVSIPVLSVWVRLLRSETIANSDAVANLIGPLLEICSSRLTRYEWLPEDSGNATVLFLLEDIDTMPERHAFLGNYRRYCVQIIEMIVQGKPFEAFCHVLTQVDHSLKTLYDGQPPFQGKSVLRAYPHRC